MTDLLTIIVPVYNVEKHVERMLQSVCAQTYENLQIILIDDGSTDGSLQICKEWEKKDKRIKVYTQQNCGVAKTRNRGIELAEGKYLMFVDADDWIEPDMLQVLYDAAVKYGADVANCMLQEEKNETQKSADAFRICEKGDMKVSCFETREESGLALLLVWGPVCKLYRTDIVRDIRFEEYKIGEDLLFNTNVICNDKFQRVATVYYPFYHYIIYPGSAMQQSFQQKYLDAMKVEEECYDKLTAISEKYADINLIGCSVSRVFEKYAVLSRKEKKKYRNDFKYCKQFAKQHKKALLGTTNFHRKISGWVKVYIPDIYIWILGISKRGNVS